MGVKCFLATPIGHRGEYIALWPRNAAGTCTGHGHVARHNVGERTDETPPSLDAPEAHGWVGACERCGEPIPWEAIEPCDCKPGCPGRRSVSLSAGTMTVFDTPDGTLGPGAMYYREHRDDSWCTGRWTNCDGRHLHVVLPNRIDWDVDSRASNCTMPNDTTHRCWIREGDPPNVTAGKNGHTCTAGAGSIQAGDYHGFLQGGALT